MHAKRVGAAGRCHGQADDEDAKEDNQNVLAFACGLLMNRVDSSSWM